MRIPRQLRLAGCTALMLGLAVLAAAGPAQAQDAGIVFQSSVAASSPS
jgi:hypothetical protein